MKKNYLKITLKSLINLKSKNSGYLFFLFLLLLAGNISAQVSYTFTSAGASGSVGPTQGQINSTYSLTNLNGLVTATAGVQFWVVPSSANYSIETTGASGGGISGGLGAKTKGEFFLTAGDTILIMVGQMGIDGLDGSTTGGGGSFAILRNGSSTITTSNGRPVSPLIIAGGGGGNPGTSDVNCNAALTTSANMGNGGTGSGIGGVNGNGGGISVPSGNNRGGGGGGFLTDGEHTGTCGTGGLESGRSFLNGGTGGLSTTCSTGYPGGFGGGGGAISSGWRSSGGGGGYSGGGGGQTNSIATNHRGGGGASYNGGTNQVNAVNTSTGHGRVIIGEVCNISLTASGANSLTPSICSGQSLTLTTNAVSNYSWSTGATTASIVVTPNSTTVYSLSAMSVSNCITARSITVVVSSGLPTLSITSTTTQVCLGSTVNIAASGALTYTWSSGISNGVTFTPTSTTIYNVSGQNGCGTTTAAITISVSPLNVVALSSSSIICSSNVTTLSAGGATTYTWLPGNISGPNVIVSPLSTTIYTVNGESGVCSGTTTITIMTNPNPTVSSSSSSSVVCAGQTATFTAYGADTYSWQTGSTNSVIVVSPTSPTAITVYGTNMFGCTSSTQQIVLVNPSPTLNLVASNTLICLGGTVNFTASSTANNYSWSTGATSSTETVSPISNTIYYVSSTSNSCTSTQSVGVSVFTQTLSVSPSTAICMGTTVNLNASGGTTYSWSDGSTSSGISVSPNTTTVYIVTANTQTNNMNCASSGTINITVNPNPTVSVAFTKTVICKGESSTMTASGASSYLWNTSDAVASISVSPTANTNYTVTGTNAEGCVNTQTVSLKVLPCVGINELNTTNYELSIYPNPSNGEFTIKSDVSISLNVINELGQTIRTITLNDINNLQVNVSDLANGIYFIVGKNESVKVNQKIVVAK